MDGYVRALTARLWGVSVGRGQLGLVLGFSEPADFAGPFHDPFGVGCGPLQVVGELGDPRRRASAILLVSLVGGVDVRGYGELGFPEFRVVSPDVSEQVGDVVGPVVRGAVGLQERLHGELEGVLALLSDDDVIHASLSHHLEGFQVGFGVPHVLVVGVSVELELRLLVLVVVCGVVFRSRHGGSPLAALVSTELT